MNKPKTPQKENLTGVSGRDKFQTPDYATDIIIRFLNNASWSPIKPNRIWECAAGERKIVKRLNSCGFYAYGTDLQDEFPVNFLLDPAPVRFDCIVTNPPFSLKNKFLLRCVEYDVPFALLVPAEYAIWVIDAVEKYGCEKIIPRRRIDYITPDILQRIHEGEVWEAENPKQYYPDFGSDYKTLKEFKEMHPDTWKRVLAAYKGRWQYDSIYDAPAKLLRKYSSSQFHSMWLTRYFNLGKSETFVELTNEDKDNI